MTLSTTTYVLLDLADPLLAARAGEALAGEAWTLLAPGASFADVLVSDKAAPEDNALPPETTARLWIGDAIQDWSADVRNRFDDFLPTDFSPRELQLACRLLARVARLRREVAERSQREAELTLEAGQDPLTGIANRRAWDAACKATITSGDGPCCVAMIDVDLFKQVNDAHGHDAGDDVLKSVAEALVGGVRQTDLVARVGGDEFALLMPGLAAEHAFPVLERLRREVVRSISQNTGTPAAAAVGGADVFADQGPEDVTLSMGYTVLLRPQPLSAVKRAYSAAARALRSAKHRGRNCTVGNEFDGD